MCDLWESCLVLGCVGSMSADSTNGVHNTKGKIDREKMLQFKYDLAKFISQLFLSTLSILLLYMIKVHNYYTEILFTEIQFKKL